MPTKRKAKDAQVEAARLLDRLSGKAEAGDYKYSQSQLYGATRRIQDLGYVWNSDEGRWFMARRRKENAADQAMRLMRRLMGHSELPPGQSFSKVQLRRALRFVVKHGYVWSDSQQTWVDRPSYFERGK